MDAKRQKEKSRIKSGTKTTDMKIWNTSASKFYSEMMNGLASFFGLDAEETTEAEVHQKLTEAGSLAEIRAAALQEANDAVSAQMTDFQGQLSALTSQFNDLKADADAKATKVDELETELKTVKGQLSEKDTELAGLKSQNQSLSGEVAGLKAGKPVDKNTPPDGSKPISRTTAANGGIVLSQNEMDEAYNKAVGLN